MPEPRQEERGNEPHHEEGNELGRGRPVQEQRETENEYQHEAEEEIRAGEEHEGGGVKRRSTGRPALDSELAQVREHGQPGERTPEICAGSRRKDALRAGRKLVDRQAAADVVVTQGRCSAFALTVAGEHGSMIARATETLA
jgi:hypothetical protein